MIWGYHYFRKHPYTIPIFQGSFRVLAVCGLGGFSFGAILAMEVARWGSPGAGDGGWWWQVTYPPQKKGSVVVEMDGFHRFINLFIIYLFFLFFFWWRLLRDCSRPKFFHKWGGVSKGWNAMSWETGKKYKPPIYPPKNTSGWVKVPPIKSPGKVGGGNR